MIGRHVMTQELFGKKAVSKLLLAAAMGATLTPSAWAAAGDYTPLGIKNGPFTIFLNSATSVEFDDNVLALPDGIEFDDTILRLGGGVEARGKFSGGSTLDLYANGQYGAYTDIDELNYFDGKVGLRSRTFFSKAVSLRAKSEYSYEHEEFGIYNALFVAAVGDEPVTLSKLTGALALDIKPGRTGFTIGADATGRLYNDQDAAGGGSIVQEHRNYWDVNYFIEFSQDIDKTTGFFLKANGNGRAYPDRSYLAPTLVNAPGAYDSTADSPGRPNRDSMGFDVTVGARVKATGTINLEAYAGYINKEFDDSNFETINDFIFGGNMKWTPSAFFEMKVKADRSILETNDALNSSYIASKAETTLSIFPLENLTFWTTGRYVNRDYQQSKFGEFYRLTERDDDILFAEIGGEFKVNRNVGIGAHYNYSQRDSNVSNDPNYISPAVIDVDYGRSKAMLELNLAY